VPARGTVTSGWRVSDSGPKGKIWSNLAMLVPEGKSPHCYPLLKARNEAAQCF
jgi:hypothetical protein